MEPFDWLGDQIRLKAGWRSVRECGELCVMIIGGQLMLKWFAGNWDMKYQVYMYIYFLSCHGHSTELQHYVHSCTVKVTNYLLIESIHRKRL